MVHRPRNPGAYCRGLEKPSVFLAAADRISDLARNAVRDELLAEPLFIWEGNRVGGSAPPVRLDEKRWLLPYHGKQDDVVGYTQGFMILEEVPGRLPRVVHRCPDRIFFATESWELQGKFPIPCVFTCGALRIGRDLLMAYGAADTVCGVARVDLEELVRAVERFGPDGRPN